MKKTRKPLIIHVAPAWGWAPGWWSARKGGSIRASFTGLCRSDAIHLAKDMAKKRHAIAAIHGRNGGIVGWHDYSKQKP